MRQTKKARAFELFKQCYLPISQEVKALGLHPSKRYKYFHEWENQGKPSEPSGQGKPAMVSSSMPSGETIGGIDETKAKTEKDQKTEAQSEETISQEEQMDEGLGEDIVKPEEPPFR